MIKAIIFDIDDTLYNEIDFVKSGYKVVSKDIAKKYNYKKGYIYSELLNLFKVSSKNVFDRLLKKLKIDYEQEYVDYLIKLYREHMPEISINKKTKKTLTLLKNQGYKICVISDGNYLTQKNKCISLGLYELIDKIILTDELGKNYWKPNPTSFEIIMNEFKLKENEMIYVGDNPKKDFYIKKYKSIYTARLYNPSGIYYNEKYLGGIEEDYKIENLRDLIKILKNRGNKI